METIKHFEDYIAAQKTTGIHFITYGTVLLTTAILLHFSQLNPVAQGLRNGFFAISILLLASGIGFTINQNNLLKEKIATYQSNPQKFKKQEVDRMQKVNKSVPNIILSLSIILILLILASVLFVSNPPCKEILVSVLIYILGLLIMESISYLSVKYYLQSLLN